jgi:hypothetical protein
MKNIQMNLYILGDGTLALSLSLSEEELSAINQNPDSVRRKRMKKKREKRRQDKSKKI